MRVSAVRQGIATAIVTAMGADGWRESPVPYDLFGRMEGESRLHLGFAVGVPRSTFLEPRQRVAVGSFTDTVVGVKWAYQLAALGQIESFDTALDDAEAALLAALAGAGTGVTLVDATRRVDPGPWAFGEITARVAHPFSLS